MLLRLLSSCSPSYPHPPPPPSFSSPSSVVAFCFDDRVELVVRAGLFSSPHFPSRVDLGNPNRYLTHPHCESILIEQRRRLDCLRPCLYNNYHPCSLEYNPNTKNYQESGTPSVSYNAASVLQLPGPVRRTQLVFHCSVRISK